MDTDNLFFLDMDLSILGADRGTYVQYTEQIKKEYTTYYDKNNYKKGRFVAMKKFLDRERIFYTDCFYDRYEQIARENITFEISKIEKEIS